MKKLSPRFSTGSGGVPSGAITAVGRRVLLSTRPVRIVLAIIVCYFIFSLFMHQRWKNVKAPDAVAAGRPITGGSLLNQNLNLLAREKAAGEEEPVLAPKDVFHYGSDIEHAQVVSSSSLESPQPQLRGVAVVVRQDHKTQMVKMQRVRRLAMHVNVTVVCHPSLPAALLPHDEIVPAHTGGSNKIHYVRAAPTYLDVVKVTTHTTPDVQKYVFLSSSVAPVNAGEFLSQLISTQTETNGIVGCTLVERMKDKRVVVSSHGYEVVADFNQRLHITARLSGYQPTDPRVRMNIDVDAVSPECFVVDAPSIKAYPKRMEKLVVSPLEAQSFNGASILSAMSSTNRLSQATTLSAFRIPFWLHTFDLMREGTRLVQSPVTAFLDNTATLTSHARTEPLELHPETHPYLNTLRKHSLRLPHPDISVTWTSWCCGCCGFSSEIMHFLVPLQRRVNTRTGLGTKCFCQGSPASTMERLDLMHLNMGSPLPKLPNTTMDVWVMHIDPLSYKSQWRGHPDYLVGRSMYELSVLPDGWVSPIHSDVDEVWVPSTFVRDVFLLSGVKPTSVHVIPEAIDTNLY
eukprot:PhM_4_TR14077/c7_g1_i1/m.60779